MYFSENYYLVSYLVLGLVNHIYSGADLPAFESKSIIDTPCINNPGVARIKDTETAEELAVQCAIALKAKHVSMADSIITYAFTFGCAFSL